VFVGGLSFKPLKQEWEIKNVLGQSVRVEKSQLYYPGKHSLVKEIPEDICCSPVNRIAKFEDY